MMGYLRCPRIQKHWGKEATTGSYYGLTVEVIERGEEPFSGVSSLATPSRMRGCSC